MRKPERGLAGSAREQHALGAEEFVLGEKIVDHERQHEQGTQQRLIVAVASGESGVAGDAGVGVINRRHALAVRGAVTQAALADVGGLDHQMRRHRKIAEQHFADGNVGMFRGDHLAKSPHRDIAKTIRRRKQRPVFQLIAHHGIGDVVGGKGKARDFHQQRFAGQSGSIWQLRRDAPALLRVVACHDEVGGGHGFDPGLMMCGDLCYERRAVCNSNNV